jgi:predicted nucleic acid-binding protein
VLDAVIDVVHLSGGSVLEPDRTAIESKDFEDNLILDLALSTGASVIVTLDKEFQAMGPWKGRLILHPREFVSNVLLRLR